MSPSDRVVLFFAVFAVACDNGTKDMNDSAVVGQPASSAPVATISTPEALRRVASRRIYFAHQSVGGNVLAGLEAILEGQKDAGLKIVKTREPSSVAGPALLHFDAGRNEDPASKNADFVRMLDARRTRDSGVAMLKYCYADVNLGTDIDALFDDYRRTIIQVREKHPDVTIVHVTMPLTVDATGPKAAIKRLLGKPTPRDVNMKRNRFNTMLRNEFSREPVFDLAMLESTRRDDSREQATLRGETVYALVPDYSDDGRHLNAEAQRRFADRLLMVLAATPRR